MNTFLQNQESRLDSQKRKRVWKRLKQVQQILLIVFAWLLGVAGLYGAYVLIVERDLFTVTRVEVDGELRHLTADAVRDLASVAPGETLFRIEMNVVQDRVAAHPWVAEVAVRRKLPHTLWIFVAERRPVAVMTGKETHYVDAQAKLFPAGDGVLEDLPVMTGFAEATPNDLHQAIALLEMFQRHSLSNEFGISELHFDPAQGFAVIGNATPVMIRLGWAEFESKLDQFAALWPTMKMKGPAPLYVDTTVSGKVIAKYE